MYRYNSSGIQGHPSFVEVTLLAIPMVTITVTSIVANVVILTMFVTRRGLRRTKNVNIASLAVADLLVGLCMPVVMSKDLHRSWDANISCVLLQVSH